jgi:putative zinc finger protein/fervidolysin-like protein
MTERVIRLDAAAHKVVDVLLPWFVNGTLKGEELALVQRHLDECLRCRQEVEWLRELRSALVAGEAMPGASAAFRNLRRQLDTSRSSRGSIARLRRSWGLWSGWTMAAEFAVIVVLGTLLLSGTDGPALYRTLAARTAEAPITGSLVVVFDPTTTEAEVQRILRRARARIVDGPTPANAYVLEVPPGQTDQAAKAIKSERAAVLVERLGPPDAR